MNSLRGQLLIAAPSLLTPFFTRTVILMLEHGEDGALGLVLNRPTEATVSDIAEQALEEPFEWDKPISLGGPVPGPLMLIHTEGDLADKEVIDGIFSTVEADKVQELLRRRPDPALIVANYSGWGPGQLESEFGWDSWLTLPATPEYIFWQGEGDLWDEVVKQVNTIKLADFLGLRDVPEDPSVN